jgi:hypothetical protein
MDIKPIKNTRDYRRALKEIEGLMHAKRAWEPRHYRLDLPDPIPTDENGGGPGLPATKATPEEELSPGRKTGRRSTMTGPAHDKCSRSALGLFPTWEHDIDRHEGHCAQHARRVLERASGSTDCTGTLVQAHKNRPLELNG